MAELTEKQRRWCEEYLKDGNATQAAIRAGYSTKSARQIGMENMTKPSLLAYKEELMKQAKKDTASAIADADEVLAFFTGIMRGEIRSMEMVTDGMQPAHLEEVPPSTQNRIKAATELAKRWGLNNKVELTGNVPVLFSGEGDLID